MRTKHELVLNSYNLKLSDEAKKRLKWMYVIEYEIPKKKIARAAKRIGISRTWLSLVHSKWIKADKNPLSLEPESKAPHNTANRDRVPLATENKIIELRKQHPTWGKDKIAARMRNKFKLQVSESTVNRYLKKHKLLNVRLSQKNQLAFKNKILKQQIRQRPPKIIKDHKPGALIEKDMKFIVKPGVIRIKHKERAKDRFYFQHTMIDSFTRIRVLDLVANADALAAKNSLLMSKSEFDFPIVCLNSDSGSENGKDFAQLLTDENIIHFFSRTGTPTDNPRVERSHLTDDLEFYNQGNVYRSFDDQHKALKTWQYVYNYDRPHQALGQLTPMEFYELWKKDPQAAYAIKDKYQAYLKRQQQRLAKSRRMRSKEQIEALMQHIDAVLNQKSIIKKC